MKVMNLKLLERLNFTALVSSYFYFSYLKIYGQLPYHIFFIGLGILINIFRFRFSIKSFDKRIIILFFLIFFITLKSYLIHPGQGFIFNFLNDILMYVVMVFYVVNFIRHKEDIVFFQHIIIYVGSLSMLVAIFQLFDFDFAWDMRKFINFNNDPDDVVSIQIQERDRPVGLAYFSITYSYQMLILASLFVSNFLVERSSKNRNLAIFGVVGLLVCLSRSATLGFFISVVVYFLLNGLRLKNLAILLMVLFIFSIGFYIQDLRDISVLNDSSRYYLFLAGVNVFIDFIISGTGSLDYTDFTMDYMSSYGAPAWAQNHSVHSSLLTALIRHGFLLFLPIFYLYYIYIKENKVIKNYNKNLYVFFYIYIISYTVHSFFHNAGIFNKDQLFWLVFGFLIASKNVYNKHN